MSADLDPIESVLLRCLTRNARLTLSEVAKKAGVTPGTIHSRLERLKERGLVLGSRLLIDETKLGYECSAFIAIRISGDTRPEAQRVLLAEPNVVELHYTLGKFNMLARVFTKSIHELHELLLQLQSIAGPENVEPLLMVENTIDRAVEISPRPTKDGNSEAA